MSRDNELSVLTPPAGRLPGSPTVLGRSCSGRRCVLYVEGTLRAPVDADLRHHVRALLRRGERIIVLDLTRVATIDAAGISELVRAYNMAKAADGVLQIVHATRWVQRALERAGLFDLLSQH
jgi:anti-anti-sigma factor